MFLSAFVILSGCIFNGFKGALSGLTQFLATETPLKMMKNVLYFTSKALFILKILKLFTLTFWPHSKTA